MPKPRVFLCTRIPQKAEKFLKEHSRLKVYQGERHVPQKNILQAVREIDGLIPTVSDVIDGEVMDTAPRLRVIANYGVGYNNIDIKAAVLRGILVTNTPDVLTETTADLAWTLILSAARRVAEGDRLVRSGNWKGWEPTQMLGQDIYSKTLGILGMGQIGTSVAKRAHGFRMKVLYHNRTKLSSLVERAAGVQYASFNYLLKRADIITIHTPLTQETRHLISARELRLMKRKAILVNTSRGPVVDEKSLATALRCGEIAAAGLDVYEKEPSVEPTLKKLNNVVLLPHLGSASLETRTAMGLLAAKNCLAALAGKKPPNLVNPEVWRKRRKLGN